MALTAIVIAVFSVRSGASSAPALTDRALTPRPAPPQPGAARPAVAYSAPGQAAPGQAAAQPTAARSLPAGASAPAAPSAPAAGHAPAAGRMASPGAVSLVLTAADHHACPAGATACVDLARHISWMQAGGKVTFGPVQMEPGNPVGKHQTPKGTFHVSWKAGPAFMSSEYHEPMPWATFFAAGGIAFHGGPLDSWSHGCVHLTVSSAHFYNVHLPIGAEVVVF